MPGLCESLIGPALCQSVDFYCERTSTSLLAEPLNAVSNLAFFVAGWLAWREFQRGPSRHDDPLITWLIVLMPVVGLGSLTFHTVGTQWASWADVIPILIFMLLYLWLAMQRYLHWPIGVSAIALLAFLLSTLALERFAPATFLAGGAMYLPTIAACLVIVLAPIDVDRQVRRIIALAVAQFLVGFTLRSLDEPLCPTLPIGLHYFWHLSNAVVLYLLVYAAILHGRARREQPWPA